MFSRTLSPWLPVFVSNVRSGENLDGTITRTLSLTPIVFPIVGQLWQAVFGGVPILNGLFVWPGGVLEN
jgi:hypothetical protein